MKFRVLGRADRTGRRAGAHVGRVDGGDELADCRVLGLQAVAQLVGGRQRAVERLALLRARARQRVGRLGQQALHSDRVSCFHPATHHAQAVLAQE